MSELKPHDTQKKTYTINLIEEMDNLWAYAHKLEAKIAELEEKQRWIPVSKRLPELREEVFVCDESGHRRTDWLVYKPIDDVIDPAETLFYSAAYDYDSPTHWMPLPELPKECE